MLAPISVDWQNIALCSCVCVCVLVEPQFAASHQTTAYAWAGRHRNVTCVVLAEPDVVIEWLRGGRLINTNYTFSTVQTRSWQTSVSYLQVNEISQTASAQICSVRGSFHSILLARKRARIAKVKAYKTYVAPQASPILQLQWCFCVTDSACVQPIDRGPSLHPWTLTCNQTDIHSPGLPFDDLHPRNLYNYIDYYSFTNPKGMEGWVGCL